MALHSFMSNNHKPQKQKMRKKAWRSVTNQKKKDSKVDRLANVEYLEFMSKEQIKKLKTSKCTKLLSGKRQQKILKKLRHANRDKNTMECETDSKTEKSDDRKSTEMTDVEMKDIEMAEEK